MWSGPLPRSRTTSIRTTTRTGGIAMTMTATVPNGKPQRKQLSDELDRLDNIIEGLANGLPEAVAEACKEGARQAIRDALIEVLTNPELRGLLAKVSVAPTNTSTPASSKPSLWSRIKARVAA